MDEQVRSYIHRMLHISLKSFTTFSVRNGYASVWISCLVFYADTVNS